ncbi:hypothetical protein [Streptomyces sp. NPDC088794]|uniref:hypothetical protein n=1 Tax=Streptomyces sp. NPDC088794 TaxID=3365902 RepID=UPI00380BDAF1
MRIRATVAAVTGALALSAFAAPASQAADSAWFVQAQAAKAHAGQSVSSAKSALAADAAAADLGVTFSNLKVAKAVKVGTSAHVSTTVTYTLTHGANYDLTSDDFANGPYLYKGKFEAPDAVLFGYDAATCNATSTTTANCSGKIDIYPGEGDLINSDAGKWSAGALALQYSTGDVSDQGALGSTLVQRASQLTVNAAPEPVKKGKTVTVTGKLSRANWETNKYAGYATQKVVLQFRKKTSSTYTNVKGITSSSTGTLKTTTKATVDGYYRFTFAGTTTTPAVSAAGDYVDVK